MPASDGIRSLLAEAPLIDGHNDMISKIRDQAGLDFGRLDIAVAQPEALQTDLPRLEAGGVGAQFWSVWMPCSATGEALATGTLEQFEGIHRIQALYPDRTALALTADDIEKINGEGRIASLIGVEGGHQILGSLDVLRLFHRLGARYLTLTHTRNTGWADSCADVVGTGGLSDFGRRVVAELNDLGMLADLSHTSQATMHAVLDVTRAPGFFSHSGAHAVCGHARNVPDAVLHRVRSSNGIVMAVFLPEFLSEDLWNWEKARTAFRAGAADTGSPVEDAVAEWEREHPCPAVGITDIVRHLDHLREVMGVDHVGIGSDFDGMTPPSDIPSVEYYPHLFDALERGGWSHADLRKLARDNALRVLRDTQDVARSRA
ncbi:membrane dipeptidase [Pseudonocardia sediminis]|uniref:Membrane dipeptidase n=1 Tax=Pseudonocardia sediminis TaxID=1397368 RepID=A0A4Q7UXN1_PSEST|nr:dipeptidase [Pseudonocardia sediminis]RZT85808.1 membrane dipeptidase [Pseudonocardia sediminis]